MRKKTLVTVLLTVILFISACVLTVATVYRVSAVTLEISVVSEEAKGEAEELEKAIAAKYKKESIFSVTKRAAKKEFERYPHLRMTGFENSYPNRLIVKGIEDPEVYAVEKENGYYILGGDGAVLCERETPLNRSDGKNNVVLKGVTVSCGKGEIPTDSDFTTAFALCKALDERLDGIRANILTATLEKPTSKPEDAILRLFSKEGVEMVVYHPLQNATLKADALAEYYKNMNTVDRLSGTVFVSDDGKCSYEP